MTKSRFDVNIAGGSIKNQLKVERVLQELKLFQSEEHQPFYWPAGHPAILLVHGFPGTPAELRPLGQVLHQAGWTVRGLLLPGFGADIDTLFERHHTEWASAVEEALAQLQRHHHPVLVAGYSMGAALAIRVAASRRPAGLILLAPFWQLATWWQRLIGISLKPIMRHVRPFKKVNFSDPQVRRGVQNFLADINLDDPQVQETLRRLKIPTTVFEQLDRVGQTAYQLAPQVSCPTLVIQGTQDEVAKPGNTRRMLQRLPGPLHYIEITVGHDLVNAELDAWPHLEHTVSDFARRFLAA